ncbi:MAG: endopeptidase La [Muribaculaceae bacterium]|nr:endopeptidase La [Muribaculaceae bacterium]
MLTEIHNDDQSSVGELDSNNILVLPLNDIVLSPFLATDIEIENEQALKIFQYAETNKELLFAVTKINSDNEALTLRNLHKVGCIVRVLQIFQRPDGGHTALIQCQDTAILNRIEKKKPLVRASINPYPILPFNPDDEEIRNSYELIAQLYTSMIGMIGEEEGKQIKFQWKQYKDDLVRSAGFIVSHSPISTAERQVILEKNDFKDKLHTILDTLTLACQRLRLRVELQKRTQEEMGKRQKEAFLRQQIEQIEAELESTDADYSDIEEFKKKAKTKKWDKKTQAHFEKELAKLCRLNMQTPDYSVQYNYLDTFLNLPWNKYSHSSVNLTKAKAILNKDHFGMDDIKDRILEHLAVLQLRKDMKAPILCFFGPPGVGKTSLGTAIAEALGREYKRIALGGVHDEAEIRGHRRTYLGSMPGRIITAIEKCKTSNPVIVLDEIDKLGADIKGDPSTALLEVLDPEQNVAFHDNYIDCDYDLSNVMFIATANDVSSISAPLLDRMELIELSGYTANEKVEIAARHLVPKILQEHGLAKSKIAFSPEALRYIIDYYTRESGVRGLYKCIAKIVRRLARRKVEGQPLIQFIQPDDVKELLGVEEQLVEVYDNNDIPGVVTGLAWTRTGGEILFIETSLSHGKTEKLTLTGNLGNVMKESATIALQYLRSNYSLLGLSADIFDDLQVHIHVPEGAIPKDGPSAGITMAVSIASALLGCKVRDHLAMTGEITLRGKVLPVGGLKEKILAARRAGITDIALSERNRRDIEKLPEDCKEGLSFHFIESVPQLLDFALLKE